MNVNKNHVEWASVPTNEIYKIEEYSLKLGSEKHK